MANQTTDTLNKVNGTATDLNSSIINGVHPLEKIAHNAGEKIGMMASDFAKTTSNSVKSSREYVQANPLKGVAFAAAAGLITGSLLTVVMRSRKD